MTTHVFSMVIEVSDPQALFAAATAVCIADGWDDDGRATLLDEEGEINVSACLIMVYDTGEKPGTKILDTKSE